MSKRWMMLAPVVAAVMVLTACDSAPKVRSQTPAASSERSAEPESVAQVTTRAERVEAEPTVTNNAEGLTQVERRFAEGLNFYNDGNYSNAIRIFREPVFSRAWPELQTKALKYLAFSYCVSNNVGQCRATFVQLLRLSPDFELSSAESGHPVWGPAFKQAKADAARAPAR